MTPGGARGPQLPRAGRRRRPSPQLQGASSHARPACVAQSWTLRFNLFFFPITILTILKCEASCVFSISTVSYNHHRSLTPERFRHPQKKPGTPCSCSQFPRAAPGGRHPAPRLGGSTCSGRFTRTQVSAAWPAVSLYLASSPWHQVFQVHSHPALHSFLGPSSVLSREHTAFGCLFPW